MNPSRRSAIQALASGLVGAMLPCPVLSGNTRQPIGYLRTNWSSDPYAFGSYSYLPKGVSQSIRKALEAPIAGRVYFAGEAVHPVRNSTVHAAHESGLRTANMVSERGHKRVAVIGAGMSGLSAAHSLEAKGHDVTVFEARDRIGGRVWTDRSYETALDLGASWIHGTDGNPLTQLCNRLGIERVPTDFSYITRGGDGRRIPDRAFPDWLEEVTETQHGFGADASKLNLDAYAAQKDYEGDEVIFPDGYDQLFDGLLGDYQVLLAVPVQSVKYDKQSVILRSRRGDETFDAAIVTLPLAVLKDRSVRFDPPLPAEKNNAIRRLGMGLLDKLYLGYEDPFWDVDATWLLTPETGLPRGYFNQWLNLMPSLNLPILVGFNGGTPARSLATMEDAELLSQASSVLTAAYPN